MEEEREYTEAELTGEEVPEPETTAEATPGETAAPKEPEPEASTPEELEKELATEKKEVPEQAQEPEKPAETKEPEKMVPLAALREERGRIRELKERIQNLETQLQKPPKDPDELISEDPEEAIRVAYQQIEELKTQIARKDMEAQIKAEVPDFFDKAPQMEEYLLGLGFSEEAIVRMIGASGEDAPKFFGLLSKLVDQPDSARLRDQLTSEITESVTKQMMEKFKIVDPGTNIGKLPGAAGAGKLVVNSEEEFDKLSPELQEKWLSGQL